MKKIYIILVVMFILALFMKVQDSCAQDLKAASSVSRTYSDLGVDASAEPNSINLSPDKKRGSASTLSRYQPLDWDSRRVDMQYYEIKYAPKSGEYAAYYQVIRERIMRKLKSLYKDRYKNGDVYLLFTVKSDGTLAAFDIDREKSSKDKMLVDIASTSLERSSPFPPFPAGLDLPDVSFSVVISFRER